VVECLLLDQFLATDPGADLIATRAHSACPDRFIGRCAVSARIPLEEAMRSFVSFSGALFT
jgi:hypothetical protein